MRKSEGIYLRQLPGGGFVAIRITPSHNLIGLRRFLGEIIVERRSDAKRREGHAALTVTRSKATSVAEVLDQLLPVAQSNAAVASECLAHSAKHS